MSEGMSAERTSSWYNDAPITDEQLDTIRRDLDHPNSRVGSPFAPFVVRKLLAEVDRLHTWAGLMSLLDQHYPPDVFDGCSGDPGPRIIALTREVDRLRAHLAAKHLATEAAETENDQLRARLDEIGETREEWGYRLCDSSGNSTPWTALGRREIATAMVDMKRAQGSDARLGQRNVGEWREVPDA